MIATTHILAGAAITAKIKNPILVILLALLSHFILDIIPHRDPRFKRRLSHILLVSLDPILGATYLLFLLIFFKIAVNWPLLILVIMIVTLPDFLSLAYFLFRFRALKQFYKFHQKLHWFEQETENLDNRPPPRYPLWFLFTQTIFWVIFSLIFIYC